MITHLDLEQASVLQVEIWLRPKVLIILLKLLYTNTNALTLDFLKDGNKGIKYFWGVVGDNSEYEVVQDTVPVFKMFTSV